MGWDEMCEPEPCRRSHPDKATQYTPYTLDEMDGMGWDGMGW